MTVWIDGALVDDPVAIATHEPGWQVGWGVFTTVAVDDGRAQLVRRHLARLRHDADHLGLPVGPSDDQLREGIAAVVAAVVPTGFARLRVTVGGTADGSRVVIDARPSPRRTGPAAVIISPWRRNPRAATAGVKSTSYADGVMELAHARRQGADEVISCDVEGRLSEGATSNLFLVRAGEVITPATTTGCLPGVMRRLIMDLLPVRESAALDVDDLITADEAFLTSSLRHVQPIATVADATLPAAPGPMTRRAAAAVAELLGRTVDP